MNGLALCAGVGGLELGLALAVPGYRTVCWVEREQFAVDVLVSRMQDGSLDPAPIWGDVASFDGVPWCGVVDIIAAGFPCQPFSSASRGRRVAEDRWPDVLRVVNEAEPEWVFLENVKGEHWTRVQEDLRASGFRGALCECCPAGLGAGHHRERIWVLAHSDREGESRCPVDARPLAGLSETGRPPWGAADLSLVLGMDDGAANRMDRLRALGNGVVPAVAARAFVELSRRLTGETP